MENYTTLLEAINGLKIEGYTEDFNLLQDSTEYKKGDNILQHDAFNIDKFYRFDDNSDPSNQSIIYAISLPKYSLKGIIVNAYGLYAETLTNSMLAKIIISLKV